MLIDDDPLINFVHAEIIAHEWPDWQVTAIESPVKALKFLKETAVFEWPDLLLLDLNMPVLNGFDLLAQITPFFTDRSLHTVVAILSSSLFDEDREKALSFPFVQGFLEKPLQKDALLRLLSPRSGNS
jgi:CheY-like chemotaxis protein